MENSERITSNKGRPKTFFVPTLEQAALLAQWDVSKCFDKPKKEKNNTKKGLKLSQEERLERRREYQRKRVDAKRQEYTENARRYYRENKETVLKKAFLRYHRTKIQGSCVIVQAAPTEQKTI